MATGSLYLPNSHSLSDGVTGKVVQRAGSLRHQSGRSVDLEADAKRQLWPTRPTLPRPVEESTRSYRPILVEERLSGRKYFHPSAGAAGKTVVL